MGGTALDYPLVREYVWQLDAALTRLPVKHARELREQITGHLDEALPPGADDQAVTEALRRLGAPAISSPKPRPIPGSTHGQPGSAGAAGRSSPPP